jgi:hypothetical protein
MDTEDHRERTNTPAPSLVGGGFSLAKGAVMAITLEEMEKRLTKLEEEVAQLKQGMERRQVEETAAERGARLLREAKASQPALSAAVAKAFAEMGIVGEPVGVEKLREMMAACGIKPEDNEFSREIIAMREE